MQKDNRFKIGKKRGMTECRCEKCEFAKDAFGNFIECVRLHRFIDWWYWNNETPYDCPIDCGSDMRGEQK